MPTPARPNEDVDLRNILDNGAIQPAVNQVLAHVGNTPFELIDFARAHDILVEAYSPIGHGAILDHPVISEIAARHGVSGAQLAIRYCLELGLLPLPKTATPAHMRSNAAVDFSIGAEDMARLKTLAPVTDYGEANMFPVFGAHARG